MAGMNGPPVLNGGSNDYDRYVCYDAPIEYDTGLVGQNGKTLAELRLDLMDRLNFGAMADNPPAPMKRLLNSFLIDAQEQLYMRYSSFRNEQWFSWQMQKGKRFYDIPIDCTKYLNLRRLTWCGIADNGGTAIGNWSPNTAYGLQANVFPTDPEVDLIYVCTTAGTSGATAPVWPTTVGDTVVDGTAVWTARVQFGYTWIPLIQGINPMLYTVNNLGIPTNFDIRRYIEVYPAPDMPYVLHLRGIIGLKRFSEDSDHCTIDDRAVFLYALANAKAHYRHPEAANYAQECDRYIRGIVGSEHGLRRNIQRVSTAGLKFPNNGYIDPPNWQKPVGTWRQ